MDFIDSAVRPLSLPRDVETGAGWLFSAHKNAADGDRQHCIRESLSVRKELAAPAKNQANEAQAQEGQSAGLRYDVKVQIVDVEIFYISAV